MDFCARLKSLRTEKNLTQKELADSVGMTDRAIQRYEYGEREPAYQCLLALADFFDVSIDYLVGRTDNPNINK